MNEFISRDQAMTEDVAQNYAETVQALELLHTALTEISERTEMDIRICDRRYIAAAVRMATDSPTLQREALSYWDECDKETVSELGVLGAWADQSLEVIIKGHKSLAIQSPTWEIDGVELLLGFGGPNVRLYMNTPGTTANIDVWWAGSHASRVVGADQLSAYLGGIVEAYEDAESQPEYRRF